MSSLPRTRGASAPKLLGAACFGGGLLGVAVGILLILFGAIQGPAGLIFAGALGVILGVTVNMYGLILLYRALTTGPGALPPVEIRAEEGLVEPEDGGRP